MNCQEVIELMQRDLDHDLIDAERRIMLAHFNDCPECAAMFERLRRLSDELENLPLVAPPFSIVDSILPRLADSADALGEQSAGAAAAYVLPGRPANRVFSWKIAGGVVAAGIVLGVFVFNNDNLVSRKNADGMLKSANSGGLESREGAAARPQAGTPAAGGASAPIAGEAPTPAAQPGAADAQNPDANRLYTDNNAPAAPSPASSATPPGKADGKNHPTSSTSTSRPSAGASSVMKKPASAAADSKGAGSVIEPQKVSGDNVVTYQPPAGLIPMSPGGPGAAARREPKRSEKAGLMPDSQSSPHELPSETGKYTAVVEQQRVLVKSADGAVVFTSQNTWQPADGVTLVYWVADSQVHYEVNAADGSVKQYMIDLALKQEVKK